MNHMEIESILKEQKAYFSTGATLPVKARKDALKKLLHALEENEEALLSALKTDLGKSAQEGYMCEIALIKSEIRYMLRHVAGYAREKRVHTPLAQTFSRSFVKPVPYGLRYDRNSHKKVFSTSIRYRHERRTGRKFRSAGFFL